MFEAIISAYRWFFLQLAGFVGLGWGIVLLSAICSVLMIPLMRLVAGVVKREADYQSVIMPQLTGIKARYASDIDRHLHIQRLYRRYGYSPLSAVRKVLPLFVQIPFLLLTYYMLKGTPQLNGVPFGFLKDLGAPDALLKSVGLLPLGLNLLPIVMTLVNLITVAATPGFTRKDQTQAAGVSLIFLVLLYTAPSALLLYWTLNNIMTCLKTILPDHAAGCRLLLKRVASLRHMPSFICGVATPKALGYAGLSFFIISFYMYLMTEVRAGFFNVFVSNWAMNFMLVTATWITYFSFRRLGCRASVLQMFSLVISTLFVIALAGAMGSVVITFKAMMYVTNHVDLKGVFLTIFLLWLVSFLWCRRHDLSNIARDVWKTFLQESLWLFLVIVLAVHYSFSSPNFKLPFDSVMILCIYMLVPVVFLAVFAVGVFRPVLPPVIVFRMSVGVCIGAYLVPMISRESGKILGYGSNIVLRLCLMAAIGYIFTRVRQRRTVCVFVLLLSLMVVVNVVDMKIGGHSNSARDGSRTESVSTAGGVFESLKCTRTNNVYLLVYDSYAHDTVLKALNIPHEDLAHLLPSKGFVRYDAYSTGSDTVASMSSAFTIGGVVQGSLRSMLAGNNVFNDVLQRSGYRTSYVLGGYDMPGRGERMPGDSYFPSPQQVTRPELVLFPCILRGLLSQSANTFNHYTDDEWVQWKRKEIREMGPCRNFLYAHSQVPLHAVANPMYRKSDKEEWREYAERLAIADAELKADLDLIFSKDKDPLIVVASDHGAYLTVPKGEVGSFTAADLLDRCGIQLFVRWPNGYQPTLKIDTLPNVFIEVLICLTGDKTLARFKSNGETLPFQYPLKAPYGVIKNATIQVGPQKGENLFEAAARDFGIGQ